VSTVEIAAQPSVPAAGARAPAGASATRAGDERGRLNLSWLVHLHWWAILGQAVVIAGGQALAGVGLPNRTLAVVIVLEVLGNVALEFFARRARITDRAIAFVMLLDAAVLTVLLDLTGGTSNPFATLYVVNVALAAVLLPNRWSWILTGASLAGYGSLFWHEAYYGRAHHIRSSMNPTQMLDSHLRGSWVAFGFTAVFVVFFVQRVTGALAARERELQEARARGERREKLASLATLAAGAAHELSTPLATIAIVAKELQRELAADERPSVRTDLQLVRDQVGRCREILDRMSRHAGEHVGEPLAPFELRSWLEMAFDGLAGRDRVQVELGPGSADATLAGPQRALSEALRGLLKNAIQASEPGAPVTLRASATDDRIRVTVVDRGRGMTPDVLARVGEPFFTTKVPGEGMGLGLFLTRALAEQLGGDFHISSTPGAGTEARIDLPAAHAGERSSP